MQRSINDKFVELIPLFSSCHITCHFYFTLNTHTNTQNINIHKVYLLRIRHFLWHITKLISSIISLWNVTQKTTALNCQFTNCFRLLSKEGDCNTTLHNKPIHYINKAVYSNAFHDNRFMNNHTCKIIDFLSGGKINKPLYFI